MANGGEFMPIQDIIEKKLGDKKYSRNGLNGDFHNLLDCILGSVCRKDTKDNHRTPVKELVPSNGANARARYDDEFFSEFMKIGDDDERKRFGRLMTCFDPVLTEDRWRRMHLPSRKLAVDQAEIYICCSAYFNGRSLQEHLARFLYYCQFEKKVKLHAVYGNDEVVKSLLDKFSLYVSAGDIPQCDGEQGTSKLATKIEPENDGIKIEWNGRGCIIERTKAVARLPIPNNTENQDLKNPSSLLSWSAFLTSLIGREREIEILNKWLSSALEKSVIFLYGESGAGKTRLAFEFGNSLKKNGWEAGELDFIRNTSWFVGEKGILFIIDALEEKKEYVSSFMLGLRKLDPFFLGKNKQIRVILVGRSYEIARSIAEQAGELHYNHPILVDALIEHQKRWSLFKKTLEGIEEICNEEYCFNVDKSASYEEQFRRWSERECFNKTPLYIIALAIYLSQQKSFDIALFDIRSSEIFRYLSKREEARLISEIKNFNSCNDEKISFQSVLLLRAMASITGRMSYDELRCFCNAFDKCDLDYLPPKPRHIKSLSIWKKNYLSPIEPDIFAADFLLYALNKYAECQEAEWIFSSLALSKLHRYEAGSSEIVAKRLSRLDRLFFDASVTLKLETPKKTIVAYIQRDKETKDWIARNVPIYSSQSVSRNIFIESLAFVVNGGRRKEIPPNLLFSLSLLLKDEGKHEEALAHLHAASDIYYDFSKCEPEQYSIEHSKCLSQISTILVLLGRWEDAVVAIERSFEFLHQYMLAGYPVDASMLISGLNKISIAYCDAGEYEKAFLSGENAVDFSRLFYKICPEHSQAHDLAVSLANFSNRLMKAGKEDDAIDSIIQAIKIFEEKLLHERSLYLSGYTNVLFIYSQHLRNQNNCELAIRELIKVRSIITDLVNYDFDLFSASYIQYMAQLGDMLLITENVKKVVIQDVLGNLYVALRRAFDKNEYAYFQKSIACLNGLSETNLRFGDVIYSLKDCHEIIRLLSKYELNETLFDERVVNKTLAGIENRIGKINKLSEFKENSVAISLYRDMSHLVWDRYQWFQNNDKKEQENRALSCYLLICRFLADKDREIYGLSLLLSLNNMSVLLLKSDPVLGEEYAEEAIAYGEKLSKAGIFGSDEMYFSCLAMYCSQYKLSSTHLEMLRSSYNRNIGRADDINKIKDLYLYVLRRDREIAVQLSDEKLVFFIDEMMEEVG